MRHTARIAALFSFILSPVLFASCERVDCDCAASDGEIILQVESDPAVDVGVETKTSAVTSLAGLTLYWAASTGGNAAGTAGETMHFPASGTTTPLSGTVSSGKIATGKYQTANPTAYTYYVSNESFTPGDPCSVSASNDLDVIVGRTASTNSTSPTVTMNHIFARIGSVNLTGTNAYTITGLTATITPKTGGTYNMKTSSWSSTTTGSATTIATSTGSTTDIGLYLVPGTYTITATYTATKGDYSATVTKTATATLVAGKVNNLSGTLYGDATEFTINVSLNSWNSDTSSLDTESSRGEDDYLCFYVTTGGTIYWKASNASLTRTIQYSKNSGSSWTSVTSSTSGAAISVSAGETVMFKGTNSAYGNSSGYYNYFSTTDAAFQVYGNLASLVNYNYSLSPYGLRSLFTGCTRMSSHASKDLVIPFASIGSYGLAYTFNGCTGITLPPDMYRVTTVNVYGCQYMFNGCTGLLYAPKLPATSLNNYAYYYMFGNCRALTAAPELPATRVYTYSYANMFYGCTGLKVAPELPATTLGTYCYYGMFRGCTGLTAAPALSATTLQNYCYAQMFYGCTGLSSAPVLPATTLVSGCYNSMFYNCSNLAYVKALFTTTPGTSYTSSWLSGVASSGTFVKSSSASWSVSGVSGIPTGWKITSY